MIKKHQHFLSSLQLFVDLVMLSIAYAVAVVVKFNNGDISDIRVYLTRLLWMVPAFLVTYYFMELYTPMRDRRFRKEAFMLVRSHAAGVGVVFSLLFLEREQLCSREVALVFAMLGFLLVLFDRFLVRAFLRHIRGKGYNKKHILVVGSGELGREFVQKVNRYRNLGYHVIGFLDDEQRPGIEIMGAPVLGSCDLLPEILEDKYVEEVIIALPFSAYDRCGESARACEKAGVRLRIIPDYRHFAVDALHVDDLDGTLLLNVRRVSLDDPFSRFLKRLFDLAVSSSAILVTSPVMIMIAIGIKLTSPGPLLFRQRRIGLNNVPFEMFKFRSMRVSDDEIASTTWTTVNDPRKTKFGSFLRKTSLDELPQFFNVLLGDMSVIGPRPERPFFVEQFKEEIPKYMLKHQVKPGITGWAQVNGWRGNTSIEKRIAHDLYYIENWELLLDIKIMFLTVLRGLVNKNAY